MEFNGDSSRELSRKLIDTYFRTVSYPYTRHHIDSYDQFLQEDMVNIIRSQNPIVILKDLIDEKTSTYKYRVEIYVGGESGSELEIGTPTLYHQLQQEVRILFPNEARLRNLTYASTVYANIVVKIQYITATREVQDLSPPPETFARWPLFRIPIMLHSRYCILHNKPKEFLREAGECPYDHGGYFIVDGAEKVLITRQEQAFNTLYITPQNDPKIAVYASIECLSAKTRQVKRVSFALMRHVEPSPSQFGKKESCFPKPAVLLVSLPFVRKPVPLFVLFRALGIQSDEEILRMIFPDFMSPEAKFLLPKLQPSIIDAFPFLNNYTAVQYIKTLTKGFSEAHVLDIIRNQLFLHMPNDPTSQAVFLGDCVRRILRVSEGYDAGTDRDDTRNQRCLTSGFLVQELFNNSYKLWIKAFALAIDREYNLNKGTLYKDEQFRTIFDPQNGTRIFAGGLLQDMIMKGFKGKWGTGLGEEKSGVLQAMSRLSYVDFLSHCRRVILDFDTGMKLTGPRKLHTSQYGYFCTSETPTGASIGITKNMSIMTSISTTAQTSSFFPWLRTTGRVFSAEDITLEQRMLFVPVYINGGVFGYTDEPRLLTTVLRLFKRTGCLPYSVSITFSIRDRKVYLYLDPGRPLRPLIWLPSSKGNASPRLSLDRFRALPTWRDLVMGSLPSRKDATLSSTDFLDPLEGKGARLTQYAEQLESYAGVIEYIDPYEQNESFIANNPAYLRPESTHMEVHPSTILSMMTSLIPFAPHNQSPRNQLSCSQSKQGLSIYATNWRNRFDNTAHVLCYGEMPLTRTMYNNYLGEGKMAYGMNCVLAIACWSGYNQEDGIVMNKDAVERGMFRSMAFRSYEAFEEDDEMAGVRIRFGHPGSIASWKDLRPGLDYSKLDERGIVREGEYVDENTVMVGAYMASMTGGQVKDASTTPQVWTRGRVEKVIVLVNNAGLRLVKIRVCQDRIPELGDKFCLSEDHEVKTSLGWKPIKEVTADDFVAQLHHRSHEITFTRPLATHVFPHTGEMYLLQTPYGSHYLTGEHRVYGRFSEDNTTMGDDLLVSSPLEHPREWIRASALYELYYYRAGFPAPTSFSPPSFFHIYDELGQEVPVLAISRTPTNLTSTHVYCLSVPTEIFLARRKGETVGYWTGNSNRHGQKGTIGALLRGHDMPRTISGIVPDMIMNPHAIPSRMTIAQNLEQLLGKTAALSGAIGDGTSFMNDGSPQEAMGAILETLGFEKYGNEVMYNGATGEQLDAAIFIGPVYGMRLKHMVEDKWNARGKGRKEVRTHQPTGGRGAQGGLKIGEMDRDAIIAHGGMAFVKESYMERSDGTTISVCTSCGMVPIYNPRLGIRMCALCDGPVRYAGDTVHNLELLPPLGRPKSTIVQVEIPYSTKLLTQEQETYLNLASRFITTRGVERLTPFEYSSKTSEVVKELPRIRYPSTTVARYVEEVDPMKMTMEEYRELAVGLQQKKDELDLIRDEQEQVEQLQRQEERALQEEQGLDLVAAQPAVSGFVPAVSLIPISQSAPVALVPSASASASASAGPIMSTEQSGGMLPPGGPSTPTYVQAPPGGGGPTIVVDTTPEAIQREIPMAGRGRRSPAMGMGLPLMGGGGGGAPVMGGAPPMSTPSPFAPVRVNKME